ncbi:hypothetical protein MTR_7g056033 [Medicago truncatula]|uniref:Uncharacterized protein n=1 Tax=Medicago truncatula TaxID=3880 RepID=A0A072TYM8_MEDTR|nr:hypothetical protein MTR_7g056033 [Medicago truncatula]
MFDVELGLYLGDGSILGMLKVGRYTLYLEQEFSNARMEKFPDASTYISNLSLTNSLMLVLPCPMKGECFSSSLASLMLMPQSVPKFVTVTPSPFLQSSLHDYLRGNCQSQEGSHYC